MTQKNDNGCWNLCCSGFEIYGKLRLKKCYTNHKSHLIQMVLSIILEHYLVAIKIG